MVLQALRNLDEEARAVMAFDLDDFPTADIAAARGPRQGKLRGKQPKLTARQQAELTRMHATGEYAIADLMEVFSVGRATV